MREVGFGTPITLILRSNPASQELDLILVGKLWKPVLSQQPTPVVLQLLGTGTTLAGTAIAQRLPGAGRAIMIDGVKVDALDHFAKANGLAVTAKKTPVISIAFSQADKAVIALRACNDDILRSWGIDPAARKQLRSEARWEPVTKKKNSMPTLEDMPQGSLRGGSSGQALIIFDVASDGSTSGCKLVSQSGSAGSPCEQLKRRGKYHPAVGLAGQPVASRKAELHEWFDVMVQGVM